MQMRVLIVFVFETYRMTISEAKDWVDSLVHILQLSQHKEENL